MTAKKPALGRGLSALMPQQTSFEQGRSGERVRMLPVQSLLPNPDQPRRSFDQEKLDELSESIRHHGVMQPLLVVEQGDGFMIVAGERRFRAAQAAGLSELPCIVRALEEQQLKEQSLLENIQREDLSALEEAAAYRDLMDSHGYTQEALAERLGKSRPYVANTLRLLNLLPQERRLLETGQISAGHARVLLALTNSRQRADLATAIIKQNLSVRQAEQLAAKLKAAKPAAKRSSQSELLHQDLAREFSSRLGVRVQVQGRGQHGRVVIDYTSEDDLQNIADAILGQR